MSRPEDIPEDVWEAAIKCAETALRNLDGDYGDMTIEITAIARAILAAKLEEREACVGVAVDEITLLLGDQSADTINGYVAEAIRSRP